ncbi:hypothetical protein SSX86_001364 [Deinandra increscens subsp. villosa]|uniref:Uncharacterized protein n=1 Tax=Deinandra increscens subsp. villosa TaxID=3103831 RepID=A0AAP0DR69_9ASTR
MCLITDDNQVVMLLAFDTEFIKVIVEGYKCFVHVNLFHGHLFVAAANGRVGSMLKNVYGEQVFMCNMGYCQKDDAKQVTGNVRDSIRNAMGVQFDQINNLIRKNLKAKREKGRQGVKIMAFCICLRDVESHEIFGISFQDYTTSNEGREEMNNGAIKVVGSGALLCQLLQKLGFNQWERGIGDAGRRSHQVYEIFERTTSRSMHPSASHNPRT